MDLFTFNLCQSYRESKDKQQKVVDCQEFKVDCMD